ncbi:hcngp family protein [Cystoisospora suis]|uniref:Hcngp family protein n=1 Tax=Cystoisospora suis TaxID=483139 RepID=A0A2C6L4T3_9APIC|nr:hcngp family protein [Cystoisospora suis]
MSLVDYGFYSDEEEEETGGEQQKGTDGETAGFEQQERKDGHAGTGTTFFSTNGPSPRALSSDASPEGGPNILRETKVDPDGRKRTFPGTLSNADGSKRLAVGGGRVVVDSGTALDRHDGERGDIPVDPGVSSCTGGEDTEKMNGSRQALRQRTTKSSSSNGGPTGGHVTLMPAVPPGDMPKELLRTVERLQQLKRRGITVNGNIAASLDFKNPYLLEKIMKVFNIDPYCSNYPPSVFDPSTVTPFESVNGVPFSVYLVRRLESRRQQPRRTETAGLREVDRKTPPFLGVPLSALPPGTAMGMFSHLSSTDPRQGGAELSVKRSRFDRIASPSRADHSIPQPSSSTMAQLAAALHNVTSTKGGMVASLVQHHLQQRLLSAQTGGGFSRCQAGFLDTSSTLGTVGSAGVTAAAVGLSRSSHTTAQQAQQVMAKLSHRQLSSPTGTSSSRFRGGAGGGAAGDGGGSSSNAGSRGSIGKKEEDHQQRPMGSGVLFDQGGGSVLAEGGPGCTGGVTGTKPSTKTLSTRWGDPLDVDRGRASGVQRRK